MSLNGDGMNSTRKHFMPTTANCGKSISAIRRTKASNTNEKREVNPMLLTQLIERLVAIERRHPSQLSEWTGELPTTPPDFFD